ncbi:MAG: serine/threonine protein kinase [Synechococcales cyanobacterium CRU_2_2]|nr:serine/threonine protein kinase [Synechococcales cyanobacterium CRU_2_2]
MSEQLSEQFSLQPGHRVDRRYTILQQLGHGGFGRTYLATDSRRHNERCVLKEFAPLVTAYAEDIEKARELFRREAAVLHRLRHPQIPEFREEFEVFEAGQTRWMLVQEWIAGETYLELLRSGPLLEVQVVQFLLDFLPILNYLHNHQPPVIHRDISLDNILLNSVTNQPTLIDFGTVKQAMHQVSGLPVERPTLIAKRGYSPPEQTLGEAYPSSDLYALGVCAIALLTGQRNPVVLYDAHGDRWHWRAHAAVSSGLGAILDRLVQSQPRFRYDSAADVIRALGKLSLASEWRPTQTFSGSSAPSSAPPLTSASAARPPVPPPISVPYRSIPGSRGCRNPLPRDRPVRVIAAIASCLKPSN